MKVVITILTVVYSSQLFGILLFPFIVEARFIEPRKIKCDSTRLCMTFTQRHHGTLLIAECYECAAWGCVINDIIYGGYGCKGEPNVCQNNEVDGKSKFFDSETRNYYISCNSGDHCVDDESTKFNSMIKRSAKPFVLADGSCNPYEINDQESSENGINERNNNGIKIFGIVIFGWIFAAY